MRGRTLRRPAPDGALVPTAEGDVVAARAAAAGRPPARTLDLGAAGRLQAKRVATGCLLARASRGLACTPWLAP